MKDGWMEGGKGRWDARSALRTLIVVPPPLTPLIPPLHPLSPPQEARVDSAPQAA